MTEQKTATVDVAIVGAGAAGIAAARRLRRRGLSVLLLEAKDRLGGRAWTERDSLGAPLDRGCAWLHQASRNPLRALADEHGIRYASDMHSRFHLHGRFADRQTHERIHGYLDTTFERIAAAGRRGVDQLAAEFRDPDHPWAPIADYLITTINAVEPEAYSTAEAGAEEDLHQDWIVDQGLGTLIQRLGDGLPVRLGCPAERIDSGGGPVRIDTPRGRVAARAAIVTVSTGSMDEGSRLAFRPRLPDWKRQALRDVPMGRAEKIALRFEDDALDALPENCYLSIFDENGVFGFHARPFGRPLAIAYTGGDLARAVADWSEAEAVDFALERLCAALGNGMLHHFVRGTRTAWGRDPWIAGAYSAARPGRHAQRTVLARPVDGRLFFAGEATVNDCFATAHGAWLSGLRAAEEASAAIDPGRTAMEDY